MIDKYVILTPFPRVSTISYGKAAHFRLSHGLAVSLARLAY